MAVLGETMTRLGYGVLLACGVGALIIAVAFGAIGLTALRAAFIGINTATFACYGYDKWLARRSLSRVPEASLHILAIVGGTPGALAGQLVFRHKTRSTRFRTVFLAIAIAQLLLLLALTQIRGG